MVTSSVSPLRWEITVVHADAPGETDRVQRLGERADLVELDEDGVGGPALDGAAQPLGVGHEQVIADELHAVAEPLLEEHPAVPIVLGEARPRWT